MPNEEYMDQFAYDLLGLNPNTQLRRTQLLAAKLKAETELEDMYVNAFEKQKRKEYIYDAYMHLVLKMKAKKTKEQWEFIELEEEERRRHPEYKPPEPKKAPIELLITNQFEADGFVLLKGTLDDIRVKFDEWVVRNNLVNQGFSLVMRPAKEIANTFTLAIRGPAEGLHVAKLGTFLQELIREGYIGPRENLRAAMALTPLPIPTPAPKGKKKTEEEDEKLGTSRPFTPKLTPYKK